MRGFVIVIALLGCKEKPAEPDPATEARAFRDRVCACSDIECVRKVANEHAARTAAATRTDPRAIEASSEASKCIERISAPPATVDAAVDAGTQWPAVPTNAADAGALVRAASEYQARYDERQAIREVHVRYVDSNGALDPEHGQLSVLYGAPDKAIDDPRRKTGAPVPEDDANRPTHCRAYYWTMKKREWTIQDGGCVDVVPAVPRCTPAEIWKRAAAKGAPVEALAYLIYYAGARPRWKLTITDKPRSVNIRHDFEDDCEVAVEQP